jgi:hypothetical protein
MKLRRKRPSCLDWSADRKVITAVLLAVTLVLLLIGFSGPAEYITLPGPMGWLYITMVIIVAAVAPVWLFRVSDKRRKGSPSRVRTVNPRAKRSSFL